MSALFLYNCFSMPLHGPCFSTVCFQTAAAQYLLYHIVFVPVERPFTESPILIPGKESRDVPQEQKQRGMQDPVQHLFKAILWRNRAIYGKAVIQEQGRHEPTRPPTY